MISKTIILTLPSLKLPLFLTVSHSSVDMKNSPNGKVSKKISKLFQIYRSSNLKKSIADLRNVQSGLEIPILLDTSPLFSLKAP